MPPRKRTEGIQLDRDTLLTDIVDDLKKQDIAAFFIGLEDTPTDIKEYVSTGSSLLDLAISNKINGGFAVGRIYELNGLEGSGKSLIAAHMMKNVQAEGGVAVLIDTETAVNEQFFEAIGLDMDRMVYVHENCVESIFEAIERIIAKVRAAKGASEKKVIIVVDSIAQASTKKELEDSYDGSGFGMDKAKFLSRAFRKITPLIARQNIMLVFTNQLRMKPNVQAFADPYVTTSGKALPFTASTRVRLTATTSIKNKDGVEVGVKVNAKVHKNRLGPNKRQVTFDVYFDRGIDDVSSWIDYLKKHEIITGGAGGNYAYVDSNGEEFKFKSSTWKQFTEQNPEVFKEIYERMADTMIMQYRSEGVSTADGTAILEDLPGVNTEYAIGEEA